MRFQTYQRKDKGSKSVVNVPLEKSSGGKPSFHFKDNRPETIAQGKLQEMVNTSPQVAQLRVFQEMADSSFQYFKPIQRKANTTGLPDNLKMGIEDLSGYTMDDVKVHYNSEKPAQLNAHAYAQGTDIHLASGQEKHLPHEAWHVVQQKQGRVRPTKQMKSDVTLNDDIGLEKEADAMGAKALQTHGDAVTLLKTIPASQKTVVQAAFPQTPQPNIKERKHGGVASVYVYDENVIDLHIDAGANNNGELMQDFLAALWEARDTIRAGQTRGVVGGVSMRPAGAQVLKMTMEMLGEAIGRGEPLVVARNAKRARRAAGEAPTAGNDSLDARFIPEHLSYRDAMIGVAGITINPIGRGTSGGQQDMLGDNLEAQAERRRYNAAIRAVDQVNISMQVRIDLAVLNQVIRMIEGKIGVFKLLYLKTKYKVQG